MADNSAYWDEFYASIYGRPEEPTAGEMSPQAAYAYGLTGNKPPISDMARIGSRRALGSAPTRLAANVGTPSGTGPTRHQVHALGTGLSPNVNALGYRVTDPVNPAVGAIQAAALAPTTAPTRTMQAVQPQRGIARAAVPSWIAGLAPRPAPVAMTPVESLQSQGYSPQAAYDQANRNEHYRAIANSADPSGNARRDRANDAFGEARNHN